MSSNDTNNNPFNFHSNSRPKSQSRPLLSTGQSSYVRDIAKAFDTQSFSQPPTKRETSPVRNSNSAPFPPPSAPLPKPPTPPSATSAHPNLPSLSSFQQYQAEMQNIHNQDTSYGGNGGYAPYEDGHRRMTDFRSHRGSDASSQRSRQQAYPAGNLIPLPPPHAYAHSGRSVESSPERGYSPARSYHDDRSPSPGKRPPPSQPYMHSYSSTNNLLGAAAGPGVAIAMHDRPSSRVSNPAGYQGTGPASYYHDNASDAGSAYAPSVLTPNNAASAGLGTINPMEILDDDVDDPILNSKKPAHGYKASTMGMGTSTAGLYNSVPGGGLGPEKDFAARYARQPPKKKSTALKVCFWAIPVLIVIGIIAGVVGFVLHQNELNNKDIGPQGGTFNPLFGGSGTSSGNNTDSTPSSSTGSDLTKDSPEIIALLNDDTLHKVFPGIDYTPQNTQWPACLTDPPNQDNVTKDIAIISQLAPVVRLYGTDCNQTEMVLHAISALGLNDTLKLWAAVWLENNATTNARQLKQMYSVLDTYGTDNLNGVIVGNEVLFRKDLTETQLIANITAVRTNITKLYPSSGLKIATSDLGSSWNAQLAEAVDVVMSNIHPFFGGVPAAQAASWTYSFFENNDVPVTQGMTGKSQIIAETGWPSGGGNDCGSGNTCASDTDGAVAGVEGMNLFMEEWVCQALENGTNYFWFEIFDEPWKSTYNTPTEQWETQWGLMDVDRKLKQNVTIPSCGGKTAR